MILNEDLLSTLLHEDLELIILPTVDSTNTYAKQLNRDVNTLVVTTHQTSGRGRFDRVFYSPKDKGIYFSLVLHDLELNAELNTLIMGVAVTNVLQSSQIKWLNDIIINNLKVGGILSEGVIENNKYSKMIIGVGINLIGDDIPESLKDIMISYDVVVDDFEVNELLSNVINEFFKLSKLDRKSIINMYKERCITLNRDVFIKNIKYKAIDINDEGNLVVVDDHDHQHTISSGEVSLDK